MKVRMVLEFDTLQKTLRVWDGAEGFKIELPAKRKDAVCHDLEDSVDYLAGVLQGALGLWCACGEQDWVDLLKQRSAHELHRPPEPQEQPTESFTPEQLAFIAKNRPSQS